MRDPLTVQDVLRSPMLSTPLRLFDCCLVSDGGGAVIITSAERAKNLRKKPVWVLGTGEAHTHRSITGMPDLTVTPAKISGARAFSMAGVTPSDIDVLQLYDSFTITVLMQLEDLGFCAKGEGGSFVEGARLAPGGAHTGEYGRGRSIMPSHRNVRHLPPHRRGIPALGRMRGPAGCQCEIGALQWRRREPRIERDRYPGGGIDHDNRI